jgi:hypothetical protein
MNHNRDFTPFALGFVGEVFHTCRYVPQGNLGFQCLRCGHWKHTGPKTTAILDGRDQLLDDQVNRWINTPRGQVGIGPNAPMTRAERRRYQRTAAKIEQTRVGMGGLTGRGRRRNQRKIDEERARRQAVREHTRIEQQGGGGILAGIFGPRIVAEAHKTPDGPVEFRHGGFGRRPGDGRRL